MAEVPIIRSKLIVVNAKIMMVNIVMIPIIPNIIEKSRGKKHLSCQVMSHAVVAIRGGRTVPVAFY